MRSTPRSTPQPAGAPSVLAQTIVDSREQRLHQIVEQRPLAGDDHRLRRHAGIELEVPELVDALVYDDACRVVRLTRMLVRLPVGGDCLDVTVNGRHRPL